MLLGFRPTVLNGAWWHLLVGIAWVSTVLYGGIEWDGSHSSAVNLDGTPTLTDPPLAWWTHMTDMPQVCVVITASPVESSLGTEVRTFAWRPWLVGGNSALHVDQLHAPACG